MIGILAVRTPASAPTLPCTNPTHLFLGTDADNHADMVRKRRGWWQR